MGLISKLLNLSENDRAVMVMLNNFAGRLSSIARETKCLISPAPEDIVRQIKNEKVKLIDIDASESFVFPKGMGIKGGNRTFQRKYKEAVEAFINTLMRQKKQGRRVNIEGIVKPFLNIEVTELRK